MENCLISSATEIGKCIWDSLLKSHFDYWWCFDGNIEGLRKGIDELGRKIEDITSVWLLTPIRPARVEKWLDDGTKKLEEARRILPDDNILKAWYICSRYSLGKYAKKTAEEITKLLNEGVLIQKDHPAPSAAMASPPTRLTTDFESRKGIEEDIIKSLKESNVYVIGICGMGGVGKTTMAKRIWKRVKDENLFHEVVMVTVGQKINMPEIQNEIADLLKLRFDESNMSATAHQSSMSATAHQRIMSAKAHQLRTRLLDAKSKIIIFDDIWESLELDRLGVPFESERCKILLTTRSKDVCKKMEAQKIIAMEILTEREAWNLFKNKAGDCVEDSTLLSLAKEVVAECKGLPLALVTVGKALQNQKRKSIWKDSLSQLRLSNPADFPEVLKDVYKPLKLSYDFSHNGEQYLLLLCCLFPEDSNIPVELLTWYSMGLGLFNDITTNIEEVRNRTLRLVENLKNRFLLNDGEEEIQVKMHDVVRDVAIYIGSKEKNGFLKSLTSIKNSSDVNCNWMSVEISNERMEVPVLSQFPKLRLLLLSSDDISDNRDISHISFEGVEDLNVLSFRRSSIGSLSPTLGSLKNLQTLCLVHCGVENISVIGELTSLKILSCNGCHNIAELPAKIRRLSDLRILELSRCYLLQTIPSGVISSLRGLEELKMRGSFNRWEAEENGKETRNASLKELECLPNLSCLEIEIDDCTLSAQQISLSQNLVKYYIRIGSHFDYSNDLRDYEKVMILNLPSDIGAVGKWIQKRVRNTEVLILKGDGSVSNNFNIAEIKNLRNLRVENCSTLKKLVETKDSSKFGIVFPSLEILRLEGLGNLQEICDLNQNAFLYNLKSIEITSCLKLRSLFLARRCLLQLEVLEIVECAAMEQVFWNEGTDDNTDGCIDFPKLKTLRLRDLPNLTALCQGLENIIVKFPNLTLMWIADLPKLNSLSPLNSETRVRHDQNTCFHLFCNPKVELGCLKDLTLWKLGDNIRNIWCHQIPNNVFNNFETLHIHDMNGIRSLMSTSIAKNLVSLKYLRIIQCREIVEVIERDDDDKQVVDINCLFPI